MHTSSSQRGFTLVEVMIAVTVIAILLAIAMPAYNNYSVRAKVSECIGLATTAKLAGWVESDRGEKLFSMGNAQRELCIKR